MGVSYLPPNVKDKGDGSRRKLGSVETVWTRQGKLLLSPSKQFTMNKIQYREYLKSDHWNNLKQQKKRKPHKNRCGICGSRDRIQIHHLRYRNIYDVKTTDLRRLCDRCHKIVHDLLKSGKLVITAINHHGIWNQTKNAVKKEIKCDSMFGETLPRLTHLICRFDSTDPHPPPVETTSDL